MREIRKALTEIRQNLLLDREYQWQLFNMCIQIWLRCVCAGAVLSGTGCYPTVLQPAVGEGLPGGAGGPGRLEEYSHHGRR